MTAINVPENAVSASAVELSVENCTSEEEKRHRVMFDYQLIKLKEEGKIKKIMTKDEYEEAMKLMKMTSRIPNEKKNSYYYLIKKYQVLTIGNSKRLVKNTENKTEIAYYAYVEEMFDILKEAHIQVGHGGIHKTQKNGIKNFANITREIIVLYNDLDDVNGMNDVNDMDDVNDMNDVNDVDDKSSRVSSRVSSINETRTQALANTRKQADQMLTRARNKCPPPIIGDTVQVPIPDVDQGPLDPNHILCCVISINSEKSLYELGNKHGIIDTLLPVNVFGIVKQKMIKVEEVNRSKKFSIREMARLCSNGTGQGYIKCLCKGACDGKCKCKSNGQVCNSRCHGKKANSKCKNY